MKKVIITASLLLLGACVERESVTIQAKDGLDGKSCVLLGTTLQCGDVSLDLSELAENGQNGVDGVDGVDGTDGADGSSCTAEAVEGGIIILCGDDQEGVFLSHGQTGPQGETGEQGGSCWVDEAEGGAVIWCADGSSVFISHGKDGEDSDDDDSEEEEDDEFTCKEGKILACHKPGTKAEKTMCIQEEAISAHLEQGGYLGACVED